MTDRISPNTTMVQGAWTGDGYDEPLHLPLPKRTFATITPELRAKVLQRYDELQGECDYYPDMNLSVIRLRSYICGEVR